MPPSPQFSFVFDKPRKVRARKAKPVPAVISTPESIGEPWLHDPRSFFCPTVVSADPHVAGYVLPDPGRRPESLFAPRPLGEVPALPGNYSLKGPKPKIYLPVDKRREAEMLAAGAVKGAKGGFYVDLAASGWLSAVHRLQAFTPFIAKPVTRAFQIEPIPLSSWGATLANLLTKASWERLRLRATYPFAHLCQICGEGSRKTIEVHELWTYEMPKRQWESGVQRLAGLLSLCGRCHRCFHPGFANILGRGEETIARIGLINRWSIAETAAYLDWAGAVWETRSSVPWSLDLSFLDGEDLVVSSAKWTRTEDDRLFSKKDDLGRGTRILGARWSMTAPRENDAS